MYVITDRGPVRRIVIVAEDRHVRNAASGSVKSKWDQMGFGKVIFSASRGRTGGVKVSKGDKAQAVCIFVRRQRPLDHKFGPAVRICRRLWMCFVDR